MVAVRAWPSAADWGFGNELSRVSLLRPSVHEGYIFGSLIASAGCLLLPCCTQTPAPLPSLPRLLPPQTAC